MKEKEINILDRYKNTGLKYFETEKLQINKEGNPYHRWGFQGPEFEELTQSIQSNGVLHPIYLNKDNKILSGNRRLKSAQQIGLKLIPGIQFLEELTNEDEKVIVHHINNNARTLTPADKKKMVLEKYGEFIGAPKSLPLISRETGINLSVVKKISADAKKLREFEKIRGKITEEMYKENLTLFRELDKIEGKINHYYKEKNRVIKALEETAPYPVWKKWRDQWNKAKTKSK